MTTPISKIDAAKRQLDTAIDLYFDDADSLSIHTLAFACFRVLMDLYPHRKEDGFAAQIDVIVTKEGWRSMAGVANFLKHADRDPDALLASHHPEQAMAIIGLATLLYRRICGTFSLKMMAFDYWVEELGYEAMAIEELDANEERAALFRQRREALRALPRNEMMIVARREYQFFIENYSSLKEKSDAARAAGVSLTSLLDQTLPPVSELAQTRKS